MKTSLIASLASFAIVAAGHVAAVHAHAPQSPQRASRALVSTVSTLTDGPQPATLLGVARAAIILPEMIITGDVPTVPTIPRHMGAHRPARVWACGAVEANRVGGSQRTCEWR